LAKRTCLIAGLCAALTLIVSAQAPRNTAKQPNLLFLFADDMRTDSLGALGDRTVKTPNLDAVARRGFVMTNAYCLGGNIGAVCTPSRNMLLSGNAYFRWRDFTPPNASNQKGLLSPGDGPNFPLSLKEAGYATYHHGKRGNTALLIQEKFEINKYLKNDQAERNSGEPGREIVDEAIVKLTQPATGQTRKGVTNDNGDFVFSAVTNGEYTLTVTANGFRNAQRLGIALSSAEYLSVGAIVLEVGGVGETVIITAQTEQVQTASAERSGTITSDQVDNLLILGRNVKSLAALLPGVVETSDDEGLTRSYNLNVQGKCAG
jgi:hypothetical protein